MTFREITTYLDFILLELKLETEIFICECHIRRKNEIIPRKKHPYGSDWFNDYVRGWNDCVDEANKKYEDYFRPKPNQNITM